jgi:hypothetical protein
MKNFVNKLLAKLLLDISRVDTPWGKWLSSADSRVEAPSRRLDFRAASESISRTQKKRRDAASTFPFACLH